MQSSFLIKKTHMNALQLQILNFLHQFFYPQVKTQLLNVFLCLLWLEAMKFIFLSKKSANALQLQILNLFR